MPKIAVGIVSFFASVAASFKMMSEPINFMIGSENGLRIARRHVSKSMPRSSSLWATKARITFFAKVGLASIAQSVFQAKASATSWAICSLPIAQFGPGRLEFGRSAAKSLFRSPGSPCKRAFAKAGMIVLSRISTAAGKAGRPART